MSNHKTLIKQDLVLNYLRDNFSDNVVNLQPIIGGEASQAYSFEIASRKYVLRVSQHHSLGFKKDQYAFNNFSRYGIPIPKIVGTGKDANYNYCISSKAEGSSLSSLESTVVKGLTEQIFTILDKIHAINVTSYSGYGKWNQYGIGRDQSWHERLLRANEHATAELFQTSFLEKKLCDKLYAEMIQLLRYCPSEKYLVHGDYGFGNILATDKEVTGVIDWESSAYGDFLFDVAWLGFWLREIDYVKIYQDRANSKGIEMANFSERIRCYNLCIGLGVLSFYAYSNQEDKYNKIKDKLS